MKKLLAPLPGSPPCGEYLKGNRTLYRTLRNKFNLAQSSYRQLMESPETISDKALLEQNAVNWAELAQQCEHNLTQVSKDVEVFCWFVTAQAFTDQPLTNLANSLQAMADVVETYWPDLHPKPPAEKLKADDEAGRQRDWAEIRMRPLLQLVGEAEGSGLLYIPLQSIPLIGTINFSRYYAAEQSAELGELKAEAAKNAAADPAGVNDTFAQLCQINEQLVRMECFIAAQCQALGLRGISFRIIKQCVERLLNAMRYLVGEFLVTPSTEQIQAVPPDEQALEGLTEEGDTEISDNIPGEQPAKGSDTGLEQRPKLPAADEILSRDQAFKQIRMIADFFQRTEPHSPIYLLLERAIRWGYLPLPDLLQELVGENTQVMGRIQQLAGLESQQKAAIPQTTTTTQQTQQLPPRTAAASQSVVQPRSSVDSDQELSDQDLSESESESDKSPAASPAIAAFEW